MALGQVILGRFSGCALLPLFPSGMPVIDDVSGIVSVAQTCPDALLGLYRLSTNFGAPKLRLGWLGVVLLGN